MKISEILREAIAYLWHPAEEHPCQDEYKPLPYYRGNLYSCNAITDVLDGLYDIYEIYDKADNQILAGLRKMGLDTKSSFEFVEFYDAGERQLARALWLEWAALMAEEQGL